MNISTISTKYQSSQKWTIVHCQKLKIQNKDIIDTLENKPVVIAWALANLYPICSKERYKFRVY